METSQASDPYALEKSVVADFKRLSWIDENLTKKLVSDGHAQAPQNPEALDDAEALEQELLETLLTYMEREHKNSGHALHFNKGVDYKNLNSHLGVKIFDLTASLGKVSPERVLPVWQLGIEGDNPSAWERFKKSPSFAEDSKEKNALANYRLIWSREKVLYLLVNTFGESPLPFSLSELTQNWSAGNRDSFAFKVSTEQDHLKVFESKKSLPFYLRAESHMLRIENALKSPDPKAEDVSHVLSSFNDLFKLDMEDLDPSARRYLQQQQFAACAMVERYLAGYQKHFPRDDKASQVGLLNSYISSFPEGKTTTKDLARDVLDNFCQEEYSDYLLNTLLASPESLWAEGMDYFDGLDTQNNCEPHYCLPSSQNALMDTLNVENQKRVLARIETVSNELIADTDYALSKKGCALAVLGSLAGAASKVPSSKPLQARCRALGFLMLEQSHLKKYVEDTQKFSELLGENSLQTLTRMSWKDKNPDVAASAQRFATVLRSQENNASVRFYQHQQPDSADGVKI